PQGCRLGSARSWPTGSPGSRPWLRPGGSTQALRIPSRDGHPALRVHRCPRPPSSARPLVYASPLRGCGGTLTRKRNALLGAQPQSENRLGIEQQLKCIRGASPQKSGRPHGTLSFTEAPLMRLSVGSLRQVVKRDLPIEFVPQQLTSYGGLELLHRYVRRLGLYPRLRRACADLGGDYGGARLSLLLLALFYVGARRVEHLQSLVGASP